MWITLQPDDINGRLVGPEITAVASTALAEGQKNPVVEAVLAVSEEVRGYVGNQPKNIPLAKGFMIPFKLRDAAISMLVYRVCSRLPTKVLITEDRRKLNDEALTLMRDVAAGRFSVDRPDPGQIDDIESVGSVYGSFHNHNQGRHFHRQPGV